MAEVHLFGGKKLTELRVVDLRQELEKRGLEKSGVKAVLVERLQKALQAQAAEEKEAEEEKNEPDNEVKEESEEVKTEEVVESVAELKSETKNEPDTSMSPPPKRSAAKPAKKTQRKKATSEKETPIKEVKDEEPDDKSEDELTQEKFDGEGVIMKIIDECQDDQADKDEGMEITDSADVDELFKDKSLNLKTDGEDNKDDLGLGIETDLSMETGNEVKEDKTKVESADVTTEEVPSSSKDDISLGDSSADLIKEDTSAMDVSEADTSKENGWSVSLIVHTDDMQDDLAEELKAAEKAEEEAAKEAKHEQKQEKESKEKEEESKEDTSKEVDKKDEKKEKTSETSEKASKTEGKPSDTKDTSKSSAKKTPDKKPSTAKKSTTDSKTKGTTTTKEKKESGKSLWVSNLSSITRAADLKTRFSQHGKVVGAKIVTNSKAPGAQCFGLVTMSTSEEAAKCISHLHRTELHGRTITVDRAKGDRIPSQGGASATRKQADKKQADKKATDKSQEKGKADEKKPADKGKKPNEKTAKPSGKQTSGSSPSASKKDETTQDEAKKSEDSSERVVVMDDNKGEPVVVVPNKQKDADKSRSASRGRKSKSSEKSDGSPIKSLEEIRRQRVEKQRQDRARELRDQRERERALRIRRERERIARERAIEREREREREKERERRRQMFLREQRQKQEQERLRLQRELERRRELERLRREREERERLERERREREVILERERINRERIETDRLKRIERERLERQRLERERADRERLDRERLERLDRERRASGIKRPAAPFERDNSERAGFWQDSKRAAIGGNRPDSREFFGGSLGSRDPVPSPRRSEDKVQMDRRDSKGHRDDGRGHSRSGSRDGRRDDDFGRSDDRRRKDDHGRRGEVRDSRKDARHVSDRDKGWAERMTNSSAGGLGPIDPQKSLSILLERAGVSGILGNNAPGVRSDLGKGIELDIGRSLSSDHRGSEWRQADPRDSRPPVMSGDRGQHVPVVGGRLDVRPSGVDTRYGAMEHAHRPSVVVGDQVKVASRDWRGDPNAELLASRSRPRGRGIDSKSAPHSYESRDRTVLQRDSSAQRGAWGDSLQHNPPIPTRGMIDDRSRGAALQRDGVPPGWGSVGAVPVGDVRSAYSGGAGPDRRHSGGGADMRYDPYKAAPPRSSGLRRY